MTARLKKRFITLLICVFLFSGMIYAKANLNQGYLYGKVIMKDNTEYKGPIRWGKEEAFWGDMFNSIKEGNDMGDYLSKKDLKKIRRNQNFGNRFKNFFSRIFHNRRKKRDTLVNHQFICRFGDIKKMKLRGNSRVTLSFKNNDTIQIKGGSNDINAKIHIIDKKEGKKKLNWSRIESIEFLPTPDELEENFGLPLFGTVITKSGKFKGFIQWDHEECLSSDILNGETREESNLKIKFGEIASIKKYRRGSKVTLFSGEKHYIYGTNDVNDDNRGIIINDLILGKVMLEWDEFISVQFEKNPEISIPAYNNYVENKKLYGTVVTKGMGDFKGRIVFDLDESSDLEILEGFSDEIKYNIPFRSVKKIVPRGDYSKVVLKNGKTIELEDERDVTRENDGILIWDDTKEKPVYILWRKVKEINFE